MRKILVLNQFPTSYPPVTGGQLRYFHIYNKLSQYFDITLLSQSSGRREEKIHFSSTFREYRVRKDPIPRHIVKRIGLEKYGYEFALIRQLSLWQYNTTFKSYYDTLYKESDLIIYESPYVFAFDAYLGSDEKPRIYNSHNHDYLLAKQIWKGKKTRRYLPHLFKLEKELAEKSHLVFATCQKERKSLIDLYHLDPQKVKLAPNGINPEEWIKKRDKKQGSEKIKAIFIGANYLPNIEAVDFIISHLLDRCPDIEFIIAGGCCEPFRSIRKSNLKLLGRIDNMEKIKHFWNADIAINPIVSGAGVNLKTLEFLSAGLPLFSTQYGARGLDLVNRKHYIRAEKDDFADIINDFTRDFKQLKKVAASGQKYINQNYSWDSIVQNIRKEMNRLFERG
ncbi:glycosyltransferase family 4 protein [Ammoniphilus sp. CFH 90114]|uniref:glycosyltransferase family 4 protein n=1 Tax=Ammoniphilus sp. CFH 90114 TaxID=2493665 RepID=UPI00100EBF6C|nr:glycosyltransferase family 4 protein [Ammoniphilus sp. CFH 90114]RXT07128.1 glycosyltransferase [Ammoniphilus sp. CFH 90114]